MEILVPSIKKKKKKKKQWSCAFSAIQQMQPKVDSPHEILRIALQIVVSKSEKGRPEWIISVPGRR